MCVSCALGVVDGGLLSLSSTGTQPEATETRSSTEIHIAHGVFAVLCYMRSCVQVFPGGELPNKDPTCRELIFKLQGQTQKGITYSLEFSQLTIKSKTGERK